MAQAVLRHIVFGLATSGLLMGCVQGTDGSGSTAAAPGTASPTRAAATGDIEAPEVFQATDSALWDGRPSLGGIWVAAPDVKDPQRVVMFNPATGKSVKGALFRRERDNPGPRLQISSDAAEALGILAGQPVELQVTALRRSEPAPAPVATPPAADAALAEAGTEAADPGTAAGSDATAAATAAAATAALAATGAVLPDAGTAVASDTTSPAAEAGADAVAAETAVTEAPKPKTWKERRAEAKAAREAKKAAAAVAAAGAVVGGADGSAVATAELPATADAVAVTEIESVPLDAPAEAPTPPDAGLPADASTALAAGAAAVIAAPVAEAPKTRRQLRAEAAAAKAAAEAEAAAAAEATAAQAANPPVEAASAGRAIQVASFTKEANADRAVEALSKIGIVGQTRKSESNGKVVWGVITTGDEAKLNAIKGFGFADAFFLQ